MSESILAEGFYFERPKEGAPAFIKGRLSIQSEKAIALINKYKNDKGYVNLDLLASKEKGTLYMTVNTWKPETARTPSTNAEPTAEELNALDVPW